MYDTLEENADNADLKLPTKRGRPIRVSLAKKKAKAWCTGKEDGDEEECMLTKKKREAKAKKLVSTKRSRTVQKSTIKKGKPKNDKIKQEFNLKSNKNCTEQLMSGDFVVLKADMTQYGNPLLWKISGRVMLQKYIPFEQDGKTLYKNTCLYSYWNSKIKELYYPAPVSCLKQTNNEHIVEFHKDKLERNLKLK